VSEQAAPATEKVLEVDNIHAFYGRIQALKGISLDVGPNEIVTLIGSNGAGKSTTLRAINGLVHPREGSIVFKGEDISNRPPHEVVQLGISQSPEGRRVFPRMSVTENLELMLAIGRALMARPKLLLLDEPSMGLAPIFVERIFEIIVEINKQGTPVLLVEQNALMALDVADRGYVLETGSIALSGAAKDLRENEQVRKTYLGED
jgi:branched-chain amino acid transport system ATP-binding protein